jgi:hypothetical protein
MIALAIVDVYVSNCNICGEGMTMIEMVFMFVFEVVVIANLLAFSLIFVRFL